MRSSLLCLFFQHWQKASINFDIESSPVICHRFHRTSVGPTSDIRACRIRKLLLDNRQILPFQTHLRYKRWPSTFLLLPVKMSIPVCCLSQLINFFCFVCLTAIIYTPSHTSVMRFQASYFHDNLFLIFIFHVFTHGNLNQLLLYSLKFTPGNLWLPLWQKTL